MASWMLIAMSRMSTTRFSKIIHWSSRIGSGVSSLVLASISTRISCSRTNSTTKMMIRNIVNVITENFIE